KDQCNFNNPIKFFNVDEKPVLIEKLVPIYPASDKDTGNQGTTVTTITIDQNGFIEYAQIYKSISNSIDQASIDAAMKLKFEPGKDNSRFVKVKMNIPFMFSLE
ncbi:MAG: energy transducer TonB, partial [Calditrichales bacterium]|nr:energy transducer TonB [Calditrichales bacterium]